MLLTWTLGGEQLLQRRVSIVVVVVLRSGDSGGGRCARRARIAAARRCVWRVWPTDGCRRAARARALVHLAAGVMILRVTSQTACVAVGLAASVGLALVWLLVAMGQHVAIPVKIKNKNVFITKSLFGKKNNNKK